MKLITVILLVLGSSSVFATNINVKKVSESESESCNIANQHLTLATLALEQIQKAKYRGGIYDMYHSSFAFSKFNTSKNEVISALEAIDEHHVKQPSNYLLSGISYIKENILGPMNAGLIDSCIDPILREQADIFCVAKQVKNVTEELEYFVFLKCKEN